MGTTPEAAYAQLKAIVDVVRSSSDAALQGRGIDLFPPSRIVHIPARKRSAVPGKPLGGEIADEKVQLNIYEPSQKKSSTVLLTLHGSGFIVPRLGSNASFCRLAAEQLGVVVIDGDYAKAPELPFPAALHDVVDSIKWILSAESALHTDSIALVGFSAGANLALVVSAKGLGDSDQLGLSASELKAIKQVTAIFPVAAMDGDNWIKDANSPEGFPPGVAPSIAMTEQTLRIFYKSYLFPSQSESSPLVSPLRADPTAWNNISSGLTFITCSEDPLRQDAEDLALAIQSAHDRSDLAPPAPHAFVGHYRAEKCGHGWMAYVEPDEAKQDPNDPGVIALKATISLVLQRLAPLTLQTRV